MWKHIGRVRNRYSIPELFSEEGLLEHAALDTSGTKLIPAAGSKVRGQGPPAYS